MSSCSSARGTGGLSRSLRRGLMPAFALWPAPASLLAPALLLAPVVVLALCAAPLGAQVESSGWWSPGGEVSDPPLIPWQRTLDDALALSAETGKPLIICVNADGEVASESIARGRYRDPAFAAKLAGFIPVVASPDTHSPRGHDGRGVRVPCPRFGRVTCAEHQAIEPLVYARWFNGRRVTPRHVGVSFESGAGDGADGEVLFDLFLLTSLDVIDETLEQRGVSGRGLKDAARLGDAALLAARDAAARERLEARFVSGGLAERRRLAERGTAQPELLRLALRDADPSVRALALKRVSEQAVGLPGGVLGEAARAAWGSPEELAAVLSGLEAAADDEDARRLAAVIRGVLHGRSVLDVGAWQQALDSSRGELPVRRDTDTLYAEVGRLGEAIAASPDAPGLRTQLAETLVEMADVSLDEGLSDVTWLWEQASDAARDATTHAPDSAPAWAALSRADWELGGTELAADAAARALPGMLSRAHSLASVDALHVLVQARFEQLGAALDAGQPLSEHWVAELIAGAEVLLEHVYAAEWQQAAALDALAGLRLDGLHGELAARAAAASPRSELMQEQLRWHLLRDGDALALLSAYDDMLKAAPRSGLVRWFAGYGALAAGDRLRDEGRQDDARRAYAASLTGFAKAEGLDDRLEMLAPCQALAHAGIAASCLLEGELEAAAEAMVLAARTNTPALDLPDGNGATPRATVSALLRALGRAERKDLVSLVEAAVAGRRAR